MHHSIIIGSEVEENFAKRVRENVEELIKKVNLEETLDELYITINKDLPQLSLGLVPITTQLKISEIFSRKKFIGKVYLAENPLISLNKNSLKGIIAREFSRLKWRKDRNRTSEVEKHEIKSLEKDLKSYVEGEFSYSIAFYCSSVPEEYHATKISLDLGLTEETINACKWLHSLRLSSLEKEKNGYKQLQEILEKYPKKATGFILSGFSYTLASDASYVAILTHEKTSSVIKQEIKEMLNEIDKAYEPCVCFVKANRKIREDFQSKPEDYVNDIKKILELIITRTTEVLQEYGVKNLPTIEEQYEEVKKHQEYLGLLKEENEVIN